MLHPAPIFTSAPKKTTDRAGAEAGGSPIFQRLFDGSAKVLCLECAAPSDLPDDLPVTVAHLREAIAGFEVREEHGVWRALPALPSGGCVVVAADKIVANSLVDLWTKAGLPEPEVIAQDCEAAGSGALLSALVRVLDREARDIATDCLDLDRQILHLREAVEDARGLWAQSLSVLQGITGNLPILGLDCSAAGNDMLRPATGATIAQSLPYAGYLTRAIAFRLSRTGPLPAPLACCLRGQEDGTELARWTVTRADEEGWVDLSVPPGIPSKYRRLSLEIQLPDGGDRRSDTALHLAPAAGLETEFVQVNGAPCQMQRLAVRVWIGQSGQVPGTCQPAPPAVRPEFVVPLGADHLGKAEELVDRDLGGWPWLTVEGEAVMVHPTAGGPSIAGLPVKSANPVCRVEAVIASPNEQADDLGFRMIALSQRPSPAQCRRLAAKGLNSLPAGLLCGASAWQRCRPGTSAPVRLGLSDSRGDLWLLLLTRSETGRIDNAHAWFRDLKLVCVG